MLNNTMLSLSQPYPALMGLCLLVAAYMFAAIKFPALRWMFRLKRGVAQLGGVDGEQNRSFGEHIGLVLCPIIGLFALGTFGWLVLDARHSSESRERFAQQRVHEKAMQAAEAREVFEGYTMAKVRQGVYDRMGATEDGEVALARFYEQLATHFEESDLSDAYINNELESQFRNGWYLELVPEDSSSGRALLKVSPGLEVVSLGVSRDMNRRPSGGFLIDIPGEVRDAWQALANLKVIDVEALEREKKKEQQRLEVEEERRLSRYVEKTFSGPSLKEIKESIMPLPEIDRKAKVADYIGQSLDWEVELGQVRNVDGRMLVRSDRDGWVAYLRISPEQLPDTEKLPRHSFARIKGTISEIRTGHDATHQGVHIQVESLERFFP
jgi:hypothetical protein